MSQWKPIDTAPKDTTTVLIFSPARGVLVSWWTTGYTGADGEMQGWREEPADDIDRVLHDYPDYLARYGELPEEPTHWMPLPEPPEVVVSE